MAAVATTERNSGMFSDKLHIIITQHAQNHPLNILGRNRSAKPMNERYFSCSQNSIVSFMLYAVSLFPDNASSIKCIEIYVSPPKFS